MSKSLKQVVVVRRDLRLRRAALAALVAKASSKFIFDNDTSEQLDKLAVELTPYEAEWLQNDGTLVIVGVASENALKSLVFKAEIKGVPCYTVEKRVADDVKSDSPELEFPETVQIVAIALGPDEIDKIDEITGNLKLI
jgi:peptidyl-tRNA hydrolase